MYLTVKKEEAIDTVEEARRIQKTQTRIHSIPSLSRDAGGHLLMLSILIHSFEVQFTLTTSFQQKTYYMYY